MKKLDGNVCNGCRDCVPYALVDGLCCKCRINSLGLVNNFDLIKPFIFDSTNEFYFIQILSRKKDGGSGHVIKSYYIKPNQLELYKNEIIDLCKVCKARAYIQLNACNYTKVQFEMLKNLTYYLENECEKVDGICDSACASIHDKTYWLVDIDKKDWNTVQQVHYLINQCESKYSNTLLNVIPTISGWHIIAFPFNIIKFYQLLEIEHLDHFEIKKQAMTLLYCDLRSNS